MQRLNFRLYFLLSALGCLSFADRALADVVAQPPGPGSTGTNVSPGPNFSITGGQRFGPNLFHSFEQFNLSKPETVIFNTQGADNILARVMGGSPSIINGAITTSNPASLYLMNPTGILFGKDALVNLQGSLVATTAHGIGFDNKFWFNAQGPNDYTQLTDSRHQILGFNRQLTDRNTHRS